MTTREARHRLTLANTRMTLPRVSRTSSLRPLSTARDIVALLAEQMNEIREDLNIVAAERARLVGGLCTVALRAIEQAEGDERLRAIERVLQERAAKEKQRQSDVER